MGEGRKKYCDVLKKKEKGGSSTSDRNRFAHEKRGGNLGSTVYRKNLIKFLAQHRPRKVERRTGARGKAFS